MGESVIFFLPVDGFAQEKCRPCLHDGPVFSMQNFCKFRIWPGAGDDRMLSDSSIARELTGCVRAEPEASRFRNGWERRRLYERVFPKSLSTRLRDCCLGQRDEPLRKAFPA